MSAPATPTAFTYLPTRDVWKLRRSLLGLPVARAYWTRGGGTQVSAAQHSSEFKIVSDVCASPFGNAYMITYADGTYDDLSSYDDVCVYGLPEGDPMDGTRP